MKEDLDDDVTEDEMQQEGRKLFNEIGKLHLPIRPRCTEPYIARGSYHMLANQLRVGWHLDFPDRLDQFSNS